MTPALAIRIGLAFAWSACAESRLPAVPTIRLPAPPAGCVEVASTEAFATALTNPSVSSVCLASGEYVGPWRITRAVTIWGPREARLRAPAGTIVELASAGSALLGCTVDGTGGVFDRLDAAVKITGDDVRIEAVTVVNAVFGVLAEQVHRAVIIDNRIEASLDAAIGLRGDSLRLWETRESLVERNTIVGGRDAVVWYSPGNTLRDNRISEARYGLHFMYSHDNVVERNHMINGVVGIFIMYSRGLALTDNVIAGGAGAAGMGIGLKDSGNITARHNAIVRNTSGFFIDSSPLQLGDTLTLENNFIALSEAGALFHSSPARTLLTGNDFVANRVHVQVDGGGDALKADWTDNHFDDYAGYDLDHDGVGDVPYELWSLANQLTSSTPALALFRGTPALAMIDAASHLDPLYKPKALMADGRPRLQRRFDVSKLPTVETRRVQPTEARGPAQPDRNATYEH